MAILIDEKGNLLLYIQVVLVLLLSVSFDIYSRSVLSTTRSENAFTVLWLAMALTSVPIVALIEPHPFAHISFTPLIIFAVVAVPICWGLNDLFAFAAYKYEEISVLTTLYPLYHVIAFFVSIVLFRSQLTPMLGIGFLFIIVGAIVVSFHGRGFRMSKGMWYCLGSCIFYGLALGLASVVANAFSITLNLILGYGGPFIVTLLISRPKWEECVYELKTQWWKIALISSIGVGFYILLLLSYRGGDVPFVIAIYSLETVLTALAGILILKEQSGVKRKLLAAAIATIGVLLIQL